MRVLIESIACSHKLSSDIQALIKILILACVRRVSRAFNLQKPLLIEQHECIPLRIHA